MNPIRLGIIDVGNIGKFHAAHLLAGKVSRCELAAVCSTSPREDGKLPGAGVKVFGNGHQLIQSGAVDAVLIATPHFQHVSLGNAAFDAGLHMMMTQNFAIAILTGEPLSLPSAEGIHLLELANAVVYSSLARETVELPMDGTAWEMKLHQLIAESRAEKQIVSAESGDFSGSCRK